MAALLFDFKQQKIKLKNNAPDKRLWLRKMIMCRMRNAKTACQIICLYDLKKSDTISILDDDFLVRGIRLLPLIVRLPRLEAISAPVGAWSIERSICMYSFLRCSFLFLEKK